MGNQVSLLCCQAPGAKYEVPFSSTNGEGTNCVLVNSASACGPAAVTAANCAQGAQPVQKAKVAEPFATTNPLEVAAELAPQQGLPYQFHICGPPPPPCDDMRLRTINALKTAGNVKMDTEAIDATPDPEIASILKLVQSIFEAPAALVALFDDRRIFIRDAAGAFKRGDFPWRWSFCGWTMASKNDQIMVIPDATKDSRFCNNAMVKGGPEVRFYCGTPLIASNGQRIGTLCFADVKPRLFDASRCVVLNNLAELVVRHLEKDIALQLRAHDNNNLAAAYGNLRRTLDCFDHCVALLDTGLPGWQIQFINNPCCKALGFDRDFLLGIYLSRLFTDMQGVMLPNDEQQMSADKGWEFQVSARISPPVLEEASSTGNDLSKLRFLLTFRPASREDLDSGQIPIGVPSFIPTASKALDAESTPGDKEPPAKRPADRLYFMLLEDLDKVEAERAAVQAKAAAEAKLAAQSMTILTTRSSLLSSYSQDRELSQPPESISGLTMGHLLGKGAYGSVYYGTWYGSPVAVKIIDEELPPGAESVAPPIEAILSKELRHPHVVATLRCARRIVGPSGMSHTISACLSANQIARRRGISGGRTTADGSIDAFSDDTARAANATLGLLEGGSGSTSGGASCLASTRRGGSAANPDSGWFQTSPIPKGVISPAMQSSTTATGSTSQVSAAPSGTSQNAVAVSPESNSAFSTAVATAGGNASLLAGESSAAQSQGGWAVIDGGIPQLPRRLSSAQRNMEGVAEEVQADGVAEAVGSGVNTENSEAYDDFDAGGDSGVSPFLLPPPNSQPTGGVFGVTGLSVHSGQSGSDKWTNEEVMIRHQTWLILEYCDRGCLQDAIDRGWLRSSTALDSPPRMDAVLATAVELASALSFLHSKDIVHGDLSAWNVMLCTSGATAAIGGRNFCAKIADFGLARHLDIRTKIQTQTYGTLTHMPAETLRDGVLSKATDVYSMGVLMWQLFTGSRPWAGLRHGQIIVMVVTQGARLAFPPGCPPEYAKLAMACMESDPALRPAIEAVLAELESIRSSMF